MRLTRENIELITKRKKTIELRLLDEKRRAIKIGDEIIFESMDNPEQKIVVRVIDMKTDPTFEKLFKHISLEDAGWPAGTSPLKAREDMRKYYLESEERRFGVVGIKTELLKSIA